MESGTSPLGGCSLSGTISLYWVAGSMTACLSFAGAPRLGGREGEYWDIHRKEEIKASATEYQKHSFALISWIIWDVCIFSFNSYKPNFLCGFVYIMSLPCLSSQSRKTDAKSNQTYAYLNDSTTRTCTVVNLSDVTIKLFSTPSFPVVYL